MNSVDGDRLEAQEVRLAGRTVRSVAGVAVAGEDRADLGLEVDLCLLCASGGAAGSG
ncbi:MAG: hypothetical protein VYE73_16705 [Acidobacteriota bacterium]|nr:hypothetical protein [Acidobacteriota bacterium]